MSGYIEGVDREQAILFPDRLDDWISAEHVVRVVDAFVEALDLSGAGFGRTAPAKAGRPGYHPSVLLKLFIYGYLNRVPSSRRLEREAGRNVEVMWLTGRLVPDHKTIADFRRDNGIARLEEKLARVRQEVQRLEGIASRLKDTPDGQISLTDPDARSMATHGKGTGLMGYNVQTAVDTETHLIVAHEVTNVGNDRAQLAPMARAAKAAMSAEKLEAIADRGYFSGAQLLECHEDGITATVPRPDTSGNRKKGMFVKADFIYDPATDTYTCPAGKVLTYRYAREEGGLRIAVTGRTTASIVL